MFGGSRRQSRHQPNPPLNSSNANPNASTAAAAAFMASSQNSNKALSSAAAAAALRARPHTPTNVAEVQTKRTMRRSPSVSSIGSGVAAGRGGPRLERKGSSASMTERTFRSPSPHGERRTDPPQQQPPVPAIPAGHRVSRSTSSAGVGMQNFRTASQKLDAALPSWYTQPTGDPGNVRTSDAPMTSATKSTQARPESITSIPPRSDSRNSSINFSYPGRLRAHSPPASPSAEHNPQWTHAPEPTLASPTRSNRTSLNSATKGSSSQTLVYDPNSRRMVPKIDTEAVEYRVREAAEKQPKKKKNSVGVQRSGSHLAKGTVARVKGTTVNTGEQERNLPNREQQPVVESDLSKKEARGLDRLAAAAIVTAPQPRQRQKQKQREETEQAQLPELEDSRTQNISPTPQKPLEHNTSPRTNQPLARKPSVVREESDEDDDDTQPTLVPSKEVLDALDAVPTRETLYGQPKEQSAEDAQISVLKSNLGDHQSAWTQSHAHPEPFTELPREQKPGVLENKPVLGLARDDSTSRRSTSLSPARQARFASSASEKLVVRHAPLPRSASPIKSALKHSSPSPRDGSPSENNSDLANSRVSSLDQDASHPRKKSVRVSFDDRSPVVVGESTIAEDVDTSYLPSPQQTKRPWYSNIARSKKKDIELDEDEVMKPRPALPSFGSVREKKIREPEEERPLIRPHEPAYSPVAPGSPTLRPYSPPLSSEPEQAETSAVGQSSDHAVGSVLAQDHASRNPANISRFREPLPPVVTSIEGYGYASDSSKSSDNDDDLYNSMGGESDKETIPSTQTTVTTVPESYDTSLNGSTVLDEKILAPPVQSTPSDKAVASPNKDIPGIAITQPSPAAVDEIKDTKKALSSPYFVDIPGGFPEDESDENQATLKQTTSTEDPAVVANAMKEPHAEVLPSQGGALPQTTIATTSGLSIPDDNSEDESNASIYSDAYEDMSEAEGDGYLSLNAVVESPIHEVQDAQLPDVHVHKSNMPGETGPTVVQHAATGPAGAQSNGTAPPTDNWEQAKSFWRSLTAEKRYQLEHEAMEEAGTEGDQEDVQTPTRQLSNRSKKTAEQKQATSVAQMAKAQAGPSASKSQPAQPIHPERVYMIKPGSRATHDHPGLTNTTTSTKTTGRMRTSMRGPQSAKPATVTKAAPAEGRMRKSMRPNTAAASFDEPAPRRLAMAAGPAISSAPTTTVRPKTATVQSRKFAPVHGRSMSFEIDAGAAAALSTQKRRGSDASDSSFKRSRAGTSEGFSFPKSMRQGSAPEHKATRGSGRFSLRSMSPGGSPFRRTSTSAVSGPPASNSMRRTLRSGSESSHESKRNSMRFPSFGRSSKPPGRKQELSLRSSRFGDSSDEDQPAAGFRSRFDDSSDEDDIRPSSSSRPLAKGTLRGSATVPTSFKNATAPVPEGDEDSPELPDSDDEPSMQMPSPMHSPKVAAAFRPAAAQRNSSGIGTSTLKRSGSGRGSLITSPAMPVFPTNHRRGSFMSNILRRNKKATQADKITRPELMESAARRDTKLERNATQLRDIRSDSQPSSPKLQKRNGIARDDSWPLPEAAEDGRPNTAAGRVNGEELTRPKFGDRRNTALGLAGIDRHDSTLGIGVETPVSLGGHQKKKKKFGALRRMFRLDD